VTVLDDGPAQVSGGVAGINAKRVSPAVATETNNASVRVVAVTPAVTPAARTGAAEGAGAAAARAGVAAGVAAGAKTAATRGGETAGARAAGFGALERAGEAAARDIYLLVLCSVRMVALLLNGLGFKRYNLLSLHKAKCAYAWLFCVWKQKNYFNPLFVSARVSNPLFVSVLLQTSTREPNGERVVGELMII
jgi:hypothetical protein